MSRVQIHADHIDLDEPVLVEGLPGAGLVGKIAADYLVETLEMECYGAFHCEGLPRVAVYEGDSSAVRPPVRLYADEATDLVVLQSDVPVSPTQASEFAGCVTGWVESNGAFPLYLSGLPEDKTGTPELYGIATGDAESTLDDAGIVPPRGGGMVSGPTGALLHRATEVGLDAVGLIVQTEAQFPDPEAARTILVHGVGPIAGVEIDTDRLVERAEEIQEAREELSEQLQEVDSDKSTQAERIRGFQ
ncbi:proteasome assembly chaperone family protein [Natronomonas sp.]|uniref:proteasome assembly chaperone family protein n=1 Tax=Natronomonas sp. TaxID=2184060 RepID=UPI00261538EE|nr:PAC2 family protein [Natronomonas sp.]